MNTHQRIGKYLIVVVVVISAIGMFLALVASFPHEREVVVPLGLVLAGIYTYYLLHIYPKQVGGTK